MAKQKKKTMPSKKKKNGNGKKKRQPEKNKQPDPPPPPPPPNNAIAADAVHIGQPTRGWPNFCRQPPPYFKSGPTRFGEAAWHLLSAPVSENNKKKIG